MATAREWEVYLSSKCSANKAVISKVAEALAKRPNIKIPKGYGMLIEKHSIRKWDILLAIAEKDPEEISIADLSDIYFWDGYGDEKLMIDLPRFERAGLIMISENGRKVKWKG